MGRTLPTGLQPLLGLSGCDTQTTLSLIPVSGPPLHMATAKFTTEGNDYESDLVKTDEIRQSIFSATDRVNATVQNVDGLIEAKIDDESLVKAEAIIGRFYRHPADFNQNKWVELFRGQAIPLDAIDSEARFEIVNDLAAAGYCVGDWTVAENCQAVFKHLGTCGYTGLLTTCNKRRKSMHGCEGRANEHRFVGMEYPEPQTPAPPDNGGGGGDDGGGWNPGGYCPRLDQYVPVRGMCGTPVPKLVEKLSKRDWLYHPLKRTFHKISSLEVMRDVPIWELAASNTGRGFSSRQHPALPYREHSNGIRVDNFIESDPLLTWWPDYLEDTAIESSRDTGKLGDVMRIELEDGHIYCYSFRPEGPYIVCHNAKPLDTY